MCENTINKIRQLRAMNSNFIHSGIIVLFLMSYPCFAREQSHYEAALELMEVVQENTTEEFIDTVIQRIVAKEEDLKEHTNEISALIQTYFRSREYTETRIKIIMYYFNETEIRAICRIMKNPSFHNATGKQVALIKRYEKMFKRFEALFVEYVKKKLRRKY